MNNKLFNNQKSLFIFLFIATFCINVNFSYAQESQKMTKNDRKELKKELKQLKKNPEDYQKMKKQYEEDIATREAAIKAQEEEITMLKKELMAKNNEAAELKEAIQKAKLLISKMEEKEIISDSEGSTLNKGVIYKVQLGYYKQLDLESFKGNNKYIILETDSLGNYYVVSHFISLTNAYSFAQDLKKLGIKDAFVSQYINGLRNKEFDALKVIK